MAGKKTGLYLSPIAEEIVNKVAKKYGYTKTSNIINFIVLEYDKLTKQDNEQKPQKVEVVDEVKKPSSISDWFVQEDKQ